MNRSAGISIKWLAESAQAMMNPKYHVAFWTDTDSSVRAPQHLFLRCTLVEVDQEIPLASKTILENGTSARPAGPIEIKDGLPCLSQCSITSC